MSAALSSAQPSHPPRGRHRAAEPGTRGQLAGNLGNAALALRAWTRLKRLLARFAALVAAVEAGRISASRRTRPAAARQRPAAPASGCRADRAGCSGSRRCSIRASAARSWRACSATPNSWRCSRKRHRRDASCAPYATCSGSSRRPRCACRAVPVAAPMRPDHADGRAKRRSKRSPAEPARSSLPGRLTRPASPPMPVGRTPAVAPPYPARTGPPGADRAYFTSGHPP